MKHAIALALMSLPTLFAADVPASGVDAARQAARTTGTIGAQVLSGCKVVRPAALSWVQVL